MNTGSSGDLRKEIPTLRFLLQLADGPKEAGNFQIWQLKLSQDMLLLKVF